MKREESGGSRFEQHVDAPKGGEGEEQTMTDETDKTDELSKGSSKVETSRPNPSTTVDGSLDRSQRSDSLQGDISSISSKDIHCSSRIIYGADLAQLEQDVLAKLRAQPRNKGAGAQLTQLERDVAAKALAREPGGATATEITAKPSILGAHAADYNDPNLRRSTKSVGPQRNGSFFKQDEMLDTSSSSLQSGSRLGSSKSQSLQLEDLEEAIIQKIGLEQRLTISPNGRNNNQETDVVIDIGDPEKDIDCRGDDGPDSAPQYILPGAFPQNEIDPHGNAVSTVAMDHGMFAEPEHEHGSYDGDTDNDSYIRAVAVPAEEALPNAIEYEPDSKPPLFRNRRFRYYTTAAAVALVIIASVTLLVIIYGFSESKTQPPTPAPTSEREGTSIREQLVAVAGEKAMSDPNSPAALAADWIINDDPMQVAPEGENLIQRYLMALFYISTSQEKEWLSCNRAKPGETDECQFSKVLQIEPEFIYQEVDYFRWMSSRHECMWAGTFCDEFSQVRAFDLQGQWIRGTFPSEIAKMPYLQSLTFMWNEFYGTLPQELSDMKHLLNIELHSNYFTGTIPPGWYEAQAIQRINIGNNMLSGTIPTIIGKLETMKGLHIWDNMLSGTIPTEIGGMSFLSFTRWSRNFLAGTLPTELGKLQKLQEMWMHRNLITGTMPTEIANMDDMNDIRLHFNRITGSIPDEHYGLKQLRRWDLYDLNITGTISTLIGQMSTLKTFRVRENGLTGTIPTELAALTALEAVWLHRNHLTGSVPLEICAIRGVRWLQELEVDCWATNGVGPPQVECLTQCCTACADTATGFIHRGYDD